MHKIKLFISRHKNIPHPAESTIESALHKLEFTNVKNLRVGKYITFDLDADISEDDAKAQVKAMCEQLLANNISESYHIELANCGNAMECVCPNTSCENYKNCCACVSRHRSRGNLPRCLRTE